MNSKKFQWLTELNRAVLEFPAALDCFSVFSPVKGILIVCCFDSVLTLKLSVTAEQEFPLKLQGIARIQNINGVSVIQDHRNSFLLTGDREVFAFKSFKKLSEQPKLVNVKFFACFSRCYISVQQFGVDVKIKCYSSFGECDERCCCEFDLDFPRDPVSANSTRDQETVCMEMIEGPLKADETKFFSELLNCNMEEESIHDVLLISIDDKIMWIKYNGSFIDGAVDGYSVETITSMGGNIRGIKFCNNYLMILDEESILTVVYLCPVMNTIQRKIIQLEGKVRCFRFHKMTFIYSNLDKVIFVDFKGKGDSVIHSVNLSLIVCFTVISEQRFIIAICANRMFYYLPISKPKKPIENVNEFEDFNSEIEEIPGVVQFIAQEERRMIETEMQIKDAMKLRILLEHIISNRNFEAGTATIKFHHSVPAVTSEDTFVCKISDQKFNASVIEVNIELAEILSTTQVAITFRRSTMSGVVTRMIKIEKPKKNLRIIVPGEPTDNPSSKMSLELTFNYETRNEPRVLSFPIKITKVIPSDGPRTKLKRSFDDCLALVENVIK